ncbi:MAG: aminopeptidase [Bacteroidota bacterium]
MSVYLMQQAGGQLNVLLNTQTIDEFKTQTQLSEPERENLALVEQIKNFSVDSLGYSPTKNFTSVYNQRQSPVLWVITASEPYGFSAFQWRFPVVGVVSYKGFFKKELAEKEFHHLRSMGYDVDLRNVSAWSTLGWFNDPLLSSMLQRRKGSLCNLLFHELFHATYYAPGSVDLNENLANFIAHKATRLFLRNDTAALGNYQHAYSDNAAFTAYMLESKNHLEQYYQQIKNKPNRQALKIRALMTLADGIERLPLHDKNKFLSRKKDILKFKNAYFVDFQQYESMQDSLENVFNKIYRGNLKKLVQDLRLNKINS